jgi:hypothetical protein
MSIIDLRKAADVSDPKSFANKLRTRRFAMFASLVDQLPKPVRIIDIGGTLSYWQQRGWVGKESVQITVVNLGAKELVCENVSIRDGNALALSEYTNASFDVAYSNSVIEHLFDFENQAKMAKEVQRIAKAYWVQTPNFWFPIEPHFHVPGWQWLPREIRVALLMRYRCGWRGPVADRKLAEALVDEVRLMDGEELVKLFPNAVLWKEKLFGLTKSLVVYANFTPGNQ